MGCRLLCAKPLALDPCLVLPERELAEEVSIPLVVPLRRKDGNADMKKQVWFRVDQVELVIGCLELAKKRMKDGSVLNDAHGVACRYTVNRIDEVLALFEDKPSNARNEGPAL